MLKEIGQMILGSTPGPVYCSRCGAANPAGSTICSVCKGMLFP